jgi:sulfatase modifying factor 1
MAPLSGGVFTMGERHDSVTVQPLCMDTTEVTADAYAACVQAGRCSADHTRTADGRDDAVCNYGVSGRGNHPMNCVDWDESATYCRAQAKRLPTEEEWEWAARGQGRGSAYPWGNEEPGLQLCWKRQGTCAVGSFPAGDAPGGIHDLAGNVWEWTSTDFDAAARVQRGGAWYHRDSAHVRSAFRDGSAPAARVTHLGFRCARDLDALPGSRWGWGASRQE